MLVEPKDLAVGALVQARDSTGYWYNAKVIAKTGRGASHNCTRPLHRVLKEPRRKVHGRR